MRRKLEEVVEEKIEPLLDEAMKKFLGVRISEIKGDISDKIMRSPLLGLPIAYHLPYKEAKAQFKQAFLRQLLKTHHGNISEVARISGTNRRHVHRLVNVDEAKKIRKELPKPYYLKQQEVEHIIDEVLDDYKNTIHEEKVEQMYEGMHAISKDIVDTLPEEEMSLKDAEKEFDEKYLLHALQKHHFNTKETAKAIGLRYETLLRKMKKLELSREISE